MDSTYTNTSLPPRKVGVQVFGLIALIVLAGLAASGWYLYAQKPTQVVNTTNTPDTTKITTDTDSTTSDDIDQEETLPTESESLNIPDGFNQIVSATCGVKFLIPSLSYVHLDSNLEYDMDKDRRWRYSPIASQIFIGDTENMFNTTELINFLPASPSSFGNDYIAAEFTISCGKNLSNETASSLYDKVVAFYEKTNLDPNASDFTPQKQDTISKWGEDVIVYNVLGGQQGETKRYFVATEGFIYDISYISDSPNSDVKKAVEIMFDNIEFIK
jgi:hypothetical protein